MRAVTVALAAAAAAPSLAMDKLEITKQMRANIIDTVNSGKGTWVAGENSRTSGMSYDQVARLCGAKKSGRKLLPVQTAIAASIPDAFDARTAWPSCKTIGEIRDQSDCGSCWAFGAVEAASDRVCIATNGTQQLHLSAEDLVSCCGFQCGDGCNGGYPEGAWSWFTTDGVATGGNYNDFSWCRAYSLAPCDHHTTGQYGPCPSGIQPTPSCQKSCDSQSTYGTKYSSDKHKFASSYSVSSDPRAIQTEIMTNGPVEAAFDVYADFEAYKGGVYQHTTGQYLGGHAIKILGWGVDNGTPYWLVANSWNEDWGEQGYFRIKRGSDECGIEDDIVAGKYQ